MENSVSNDEEAHKLAMADDSIDHDNCQDKIGPETPKQTMKISNKGDQETPTSKKYFLGFDFDLLLIL